MKKTCLKEFGRYASLNVLGMIGLSCYILADTFFVARGLGSSGLAALNIAIPVFSLIHGTGLMLGIGGATGYSINTSQGNQNKGDRFFSHTVILGSVFSALYMVIGFLFSDQISFVLGAEGDTFEMCRTYLRVLLLFSPFFIFNNIFISFVRNDGYPQRAMTAMLCGSFANIIMDYIFIFPFQMGIAGAVLATGFSPVISLIIMSPLALKKRIRFHFVKVKMSIKMCLNIFGSGIPSLITELSSGIVIMIFNIIILGIEGNDGVAAYGVVANISLVVIAIYTGISQGVQPLFSRYYGLGNNETVKRLLKYSVTSVAVISFIVYSVIFVCSDFIAGIFNSEGNQTLQAIAVSGLKLYFLGCVFAGINIVLSVYFTSTNDPKPAWVISLMRGFFVIIPLAFIMSAIWGMKGLWLVFPAAELIVCVVGVMIKKLYKSGK